MKILIIEDEAHLAEAILVSLTKEGFFARICSDGQEGLDTALSEEFDVILLDLMLPSLNGYEILRELRKHSVPTAVIILTAKSELDDKLLGFEIGADDYITKPFEIKELLARIGAVCKRYDMKLDAPFSIGNLQLSQKKGELQCTDTKRSIVLSAKEYQLAEYLIRNATQIVTREQITERVWGYDSNAEYNNVDVYISFLRKKITYTGANVRIVAVRGLGYRMEVAND